MAAAYDFSKFNERGGKVFVPQTDDKLIQYKDFVVHRVLAKESSSTDTTFVVRSVNYYVTSLKDFLQFIEDNKGRVIVISLKNRRMQLGQYKAFKGTLAEIRQHPLARTLFGEQNIGILCDNLEVICVQSVAKHGFRVQNIQYVLLNQNKIEQKHPVLFEVVDNFASTNVREQMKSMMETKPIPPLFLADDEYKPVVVLLTGGPAGGKTSSRKIIIAELNKWAKEHDFGEIIVWCLGENATFTFSNTDGVQVAWLGNAQVQKNIMCAMQSILKQFQNGQETDFLKLAQLAPRDGRPHVLIFDRSMLDSKTFTPDPAINWPKVVKHSFYPTRPQVKTCSPGMRVLMKSVHEQDCTGGYSISLDILRGKITGKGVPFQTICDELARRRIEDHLYTFTVLGDVSWLDSDNNTVRSARDSKNQYATHHNHVAVKIVTSAEKGSEMWTDSSEIIQALTASRGTVELESEAARHFVSLFKTELDAFSCPISKEIMKDPVMTVDGKTYERQAIERWFGKCLSEDRPATSPLTNSPLEAATLTPNVAVKNAIDMFSKTNGSSELSVTDRLHVYFPESGKFLTQKGIIEITRVGESEVSDIIELMEKIEKCDGPLRIEGSIASEVEQFLGKLEASYNASMIDGDDLIGQVLRAFRDNSLVQVRLDDDDVLLPRYEYRPVRDRDHLLELLFQDRAEMSGCQIRVRETAQEFCRQPSHRCTGATLTVVQLNVRVIQNYFGPVKAIVDHENVVLNCSLKPDPELDVYDLKESGKLGVAVVFEDEIHSVTLPMDISTVLIREKNNVLLRGKLIGKGALDGSHLNTIVHRIVINTSGDPPPEVPLIWPDLSPTVDAHSFIQSILEQQAVTESWGVISAQITICDPITIDFLEQRFPHMIIESVVDEYDSPILIPRVADPRNTASRDFDITNIRGIVQYRLRSGTIEDVIKRWQGDVHLDGYVPYHRIRFYEDILLDYWQTLHLAKILTAADDSYALVRLDDEKLLLEFKVHNFYEDHAGDFPSRDVLLRHGVVYEFSLGSGSWPSQFAGSPSFASFKTMLPRILKRQVVAVRLAVGEFERSKFITPGASSEEVKNIEARMVSRLHLILHMQSTGHNRFLYNKHKFGNVSRYHNADGAKAADEMTLRVTQSFIASSKSELKFDYVIYCNMNVDILLKFDGRELGTGTVIKIHDALSPASSGWRSDHDDKIPDGTRLLYRIRLADGSEIPFRRADFVPSDEYMTQLVHVPIVNDQVTIVGGVINGFPRFILSNVQIDISYDQLFLRQRVRLNKRGAEGVSGIVVAFLNGLTHVLTEEKPYSARELRTMLAARNIDSKIDCPKVLAEQVNLHLGPQIHESIVGIILQREAYTLAYTSGDDAPRWLRQYSPANLRDLNAYFKKHHSGRTLVAFVDEAGRVLEDLTGEPYHDDITFVGSQSVFLRLSGKITSINMNGVRIEQSALAMMKPGDEVHTAIRRKMIHSESDFAVNLLVDLSSPYDRLEACSVREKSDKAKDEDHSDVEAYRILTEDGRMLVAQRFEINHGPVRVSVSGSRSSGGLTILDQHGRENRELQKKFEQKQSHKGAGGVKMVVTKDSLQITGLRESQFEHEEIKDAYRQKIQAAVDPICELIKKFNPQKDFTKNNQQVAIPLQARRVKVTVVRKPFAGSPLRLQQSQQKVSGDGSGESSAVAHKKKRPLAATGDVTVAKRTKRKGDDGSGSSEHDEEEICGYTSDVSAATLHGLVKSSAAEQDKERPPSKKLKGSKKQAKRGKGKRRRDDATSAASTVTKTVTDRGKSSSVREGFGPYNNDSSKRQRGVHERR